MGLIKKLLVLTVLVATVAVLYQVFLVPEPEIPTIEEKWFGSTKLKGN